MYIGLFLENLDEEYQKIIYRGVRDEAKKLGLSLVCIQCENFRVVEALEDSFLSAANILPLDGAILLSSIIVARQDLFDRKYYRDIFKKVPFLCIGKEIKPLPVISINSEGSLSALMDHLIKTHNYRHFLYIGGCQEQTDNVIRENTVRNAVEREKQTCDDYSIEIINNIIFSRKFGSASIRKYIDQHSQRDIDVIVCGNDSTAIGVLNYLKTQEGTSWENCPVTGFDDIPQAESYSPGLTTIAQPLIELGQQAIRLLYARICGEEIPMHNSIDTSFVIRQSCGCVDSKKPKTIKVEANLEEQNLLQDANRLGQELMPVDSYIQLQKTVEDFLSLFMSEEFCFIYFSEPSKMIPEEGILLLEDHKKVNISDFIDNFFDSDSGLRKEYSFLHLSFGEERLGFILYRSEEKLFPFMGYAGIFISNTLKKIQILENENARSRELETLVKERTDALRQESEKRLRVEEEILRISDMERMRFSADLHDDICERLASIIMLSQEDSITDDEVKIDKITKMVCDILKQTKHYANNSFPIALEQEGLVEALTHLCQNYTNDNNFSCMFSCSTDLNLSLEELQEINIYRIVQDGLQNVLAHSKATKANVSIIVDAGRLIVCVKDNGIGNPRIEEEDLPLLTRRRPRGLGLRSMKYRAHQLNAKFKVNSSEDSGTTIEVSIPFTRKS